MKLEVARLRMTKGDVERGMADYLEQLFEFLEGEN